MSKRRASFISPYIPLDGGEIDELTIYQQVEDAQKIEESKKMFYEQVLPKILPEKMPTLTEIANAQPVVPNGISEKTFPWWRKDRLGYPIEYIKGKPIRNFIRIICLNIRKILLP
jgi:hypothetical protein